MSKTMDKETKWQSMLIEAKNIPNIDCWQCSDVKESCQNNHFLPDNEFLTLDI